MKSARSEIKHDFTIEDSVGDCSTKRNAKRISLPKTNYSLVVALLFAASICFSHLGQGSLSIDGVRYAHISNNIVRHNSWFVLLDEYGGGEYANKPPLLFWLTALSIRNFGYSSGAAQLPAAIALFIAIALLFLFCRSVYDERAGLLAVLIYCCNAVFLKSYLHLGFEGLVTCGVVCCLWAVSLIVRQDGRSTIRTASLYGLGLLLILQSKPPYLLFILGPTAYLLYGRNLLSRTLRSVPNLLAIAVPFALSAAWILQQKNDYLARALDNQIATPLNIWTHYPKNLGAWVKEVLVYYQPLTILGFIAFRRTRRKENAVSSSPVTDGMELLFFYMILLAVPILFLVECRARYILVPVLGLTCHAAGVLRSWFDDQSFRQFSAAVVLLTTVAFVLLATSVITVHQLDPLVEALRHSPKTLTDGTLLCVDGRRSRDSKDTIKRSALQLDLEFGYRGPIYSSAQILKQLGKQHQAVLAESRCASALLETPDLPFVEKTKFKSAALLEAT